VKNLFVVPDKNVAVCKQNDNFQNDSGAKYVFKTNTIGDFWLKVSDIYPDVGKEALIKLLLFPSTYLCECGFSTLLHVETKNRNQLNFTIEDDL